MSRTKPRLLDLFCGAGGAAMGYHRAGFDVVGVDIKDQRYYRFPLHVEDALASLKRGTVSISWVFGNIEWLNVKDFDAIHASPPCPGYTTMNNRHGSSHPKLIGEVRELLQATGLPYVIENVPGALSEMRSPMELTGEMFGLGVHRPRLFESDMLLLAPARPSRQANPAAVYGKNDGRRLWTRKDGSELRCASLEQAREAMGMDWADWQGVKDAIPPAYTEHIGRQLIAAIEQVVA